MKALQEANGKKSSIRGAMFICVITGCVVAVMGVYGAIQPGATINLTELAFLSGSLVNAGMGCKAYQKGKESE